VIQFKEETIKITKHSTEKYQNILDSELLRVEMKAQVLSGYILATTIFILNIPAHISRVGPISDFLIFTSILSVVLIIWFTGSSLVISRGTYNSYFKYFNLLIQVSTVTGLMMASYQMVGVEFALTSITPMLYLLVIGLSSMTLHPKVSILASIFSALQFIGAYGFWLAEDAQKATTYFNSITWTDIILKSVIFIMMGLTAMVIAKRSRDLLMRVIKQIGYKEQLNRVTNEMHQAADIQNKLIPKSNIHILNFDIEMSYQPAQLVSGDYYDVIQRKDGSLMVLIADVSGKGYSAALLMSNIQAIVHTAVEQDVNIRDLISILNLSIYNTSVQGRFVSMICMEIDPSSSELRYINCGHNPPIIQQGGGIIELDVATPVLGVLNNYNSKLETIFFTADDTLFAYTDGLSELYNPDGQQIGIEPFKELLSRHHSLGMKKLKDEILETLKEHLQGGEAHDDISFLCINQKSECLSSMGRG
jgi:hypothetical protein